MRLTALGVLFGALSAVAASWAIFAHPAAQVIAPAQPALVVCSYTGGAAHCQVANVRSP